MTLYVTMTLRINDTRNNGLHWYIKLTMLIISTFSIVTLSIVTLSIATLSIATLSITILNIMGLIMTFSINDSNSNSLNWGIT
jgi:hypothetical protein